MAKQRKPGRPKLPTKLKGTRFSTSVTGECSEYLKSIGDGIEGRGARKILEYAAKRRLFLPK